MRKLLKVGLATAVGYLELLWHFTAEFAPRGDIGKFDDDRIEAAMDWHGKRGRLISALIDSKWMDPHSECRLYVHDWSEHADEAVRKRLSRSGQEFVRVAPKVTGHRRDTGSKAADSGGFCPDMSRPPEPEPEPEPEPNTTPSAAETAAACDVAAETFDLPDDERAAAWKKANGTATPKTSLLNPETEAALENIARRIRDRHPAVRRCGIAEAKKQLRAIIRRAARGERIELLDRIDRNHAAWCASSEWQKDGGTYAKGLANWLAPTMERWNEPPPSDSFGDPEPPKIMM
ncbi:MAG TPA: hypothetical protein VMB85_02255 [Bryobacteraceae bacterium]|nr:hypothetical protein [Bryobacteraceae bacterium]